MFTKPKFRVCDPSKQFSIGLSCYRAEKFHFKDGKQVTVGKSYMMTLGFLLFEIVLSYDYEVEL